MNRGTLSFKASIGMMADKKLHRCAFDGTRIGVSSQELSLATSAEVREGKQRSARSPARGHPSVFRSLFMKSNFSVKNKNRLAKQKN